LRQKAAGELAEHLEGLIELVDNPTPAPVSELCEEAEEILEVQTDIEAAFLRAFTDQEIFVLDRAKLPSFLFDELQRIVDQDCATGSGGSKESDSIENAVWAINGKLETALQEIFKFEPAVYNPASILEFKPLDRAALP